MQKGGNHMSKKEKMNPLLKRVFFTVILVGILGSIFQGLLALFVLDVGSEAAGLIIGYGSALSAIIGGAVIAVFKANEKK